VHEKLHFDDEPFNCKYCGKPFFTLNHLHRHELLHTTLDSSVF
jgi:uncharacterized Zn-finger protein